MPDLLSWGGRLSIAAAAVTLLWWLLSFERDAPPLDDTAVRRRREAFARHPLLRLGWPLVRAVAGIVRRLPLRETRPRLEKLLRHAGHPLGMTPEELIGAQLVLAVAIPVLVSLFSVLAVGEWYPYILALAPVAFLMPVNRLQEYVRNRVTEIERRLPYALDLIIVCVEAGVGFEDAVTRMIQSSEPAHPLTEEFSLLRRELEFFDVQRALARLAERVPSDDLDRLVDAIIEGERQGTPYQRVLINARDMIRRRQSTQIEKAASRAPTLMLVPTLFIFAAVLLILVGGMILGSQDVSP